MSVVNTYTHAYSNKNAARTARHRQLKASKVQQLTDDLNERRVQLNLPKVSFKLYRPSMKGKKTPKYNPPSHISSDDVKNWIKKERNKRKAAMQRENRRRKSKLFMEFTEQLAVLDKIIEEKKKGIAIVVKPDLSSCDHGIKIYIDDKLHPDEALRLGLMSTKAPIDATVGLQTSRTITAEEDNTTSPIDELNSFKFEIVDHDVSSSNPNAFAPINLMSDIEDIKLEDVDDSSWADGNSISFDVPITEIFDDAPVPSTFVSCPRYSSLNVTMAEIFDGAAVAGSSDDV